MCVFCVLWCASENIKCNLRGKIFNHVFKCYPFNVKEVWSYSFFIQDNKANDCASHKECSHTQIIILFIHPFILTWERPKQWECDLHTLAMHPEINPDEIFGGCWCFDPEFCTFVSHQGRTIYVIANIWVTCAKRGLSRRFSREA